MIKIQISRLKNKIIIPEDDFKKIVDEAKKSQEIIIQTDEFEDLLEASSSSLEFWNNEIDDKIWNDV